MLTKDELVDPYHNIVNRAIEELECWKRCRPKGMTFSDNVQSLCRLAFHYLIDEATERAHRMPINLRD